MTTSSAAQADDFQTRLQAAVDYWTPLLGAILTEADDATYAAMLDALMEADDDRRARERRSALRVVSGDA